MLHGMLSIVPAGHSRINRHSGEPSHHLAACTALHCLLQSPMWSDNSVPISARLVGSACHLPANASAASPDLAASLAATSADPATAYSAYGVGGLSLRLEFNATTAKAPLSVYVCQDGEGVTFPARCRGSLQAPKRVLIVVPATVTIELEPLVVALDPGSSNASSSAGVVVRVVDADGGVSTLRLLYSTLAVSQVFFRSSPLHALGDRFRM